MVFILKLWSGVLLSFGYRSFSCDTGYHSYLTWCYGVSFYCSYDFISITFLQFDYEVPFVLLLGVGEELSVWDLLSFLNLLGSNIYQIFGLYLWKYFFCSSLLFLDSSNTYLSLHVSFSSYFSVLFILNYFCGNQ